MKNKYGFSLMLIILLALLAQPAAAAPVTASLPDFTVRLNGVETLPDAFNEYPLLSYQNVTYFPMTWYNCRLLGLSTQWTTAKGLAIEQDNTITSGMGYYSRQQENPRTVQVSVPNFAITVNGQAIDNNKEPYPLLTFRDITYFPLTWRFAHDAFGWDYEYTEEEGLSITSGNPQTIHLPVIYGRTSQTSIRLLEKGYYYYFAGADAYEAAFSSSAYWYGEPKQKGVAGIVRAPWDNSAHAQLIYSFDQQPALVDFTMLDYKPYVIYQQQIDEPLQLLQIHNDGSCQPVKLNLADYVNGSSQGNRQGQWTYAIRNQVLSRSTNGSDWTAYSAGKASWYGLVGNHVYYIQPIDSQNGHLYRATGSSTDQKLTDEKIRATTIQDGHIVCLLDASEDYGAKIFDADGILKLSITGPVDMISICDNTVMVQNNAGESEDRIKLIHM